MATTDVILVGPKDILTASRSTVPGDPGKRPSVRGGIALFISVSLSFEPENRALKSTNGLSASLRSVTSVNQDDRVSAAASVTRIS